MGARHELCGVSAPRGFDCARVVARRHGGYSVTRPRDRADDDERRPSPSGESVAFLILGGVVTGGGAGAGLDWVVDKFPLCTVIGVFVGFALALYAVYLETKPR